MGVSCRACGVDGPGEGVFSLSEVAYDGAIPGDGRIGGRCFGQAGEGDDSSEDQTVGDSILKGERAAVVEDSSDEEGAHQKSPAKKEKGEAKKQKGKRAAVVVDSSDEEGAHRESPRDQQKGKRPAAVPVVDSSDEEGAHLSSATKQQKS